MKSAHDPRHKKRQQTIKELFASSFTEQNIGDTTRTIVGLISQLDEEIKNSAPTWPIEKINRIDLAILRHATYEMLHTETPPKVVIDEAIELAKEFGGENSPSFINGVLGNILTRNQKESENEDGIE